MLVYIDETGDHNLVKIDPQYPIFGLGALLISETEYIKMDEAINSIKRKFFNDDKTFILHSSELKRPLNQKSDKRNICMLDSKKRESFYKVFDERILKDIDFKIVSCFIRKQLMVSKYSYPVDPYHFSFENLLNRIIKYGNGFNNIYAEKRGPELDNELLTEYEKLSKTGIHLYSADTVVTKTSFKLINKKENINGLQVIDLILSCIARMIYGKKRKMINNDLSPDLIMKKIACPITIFPKKNK